MNPPRAPRLGLLLCLCCAPAARAEDVQQLAAEAVEAAAPSACAARLASIDWRRNLGLLVLDTERELFQDYVFATTRRIATMEDGYAELEALLERARDEVRTPAATACTPRECLTSIHELLLAEGFQYRDYGTSGNNLLGYHTLSFGLLRRELDCSMYVYLYLALAEELELPLVALSMPEHVTLRWVAADSASFNWEATLGEVLPDTFYLRWKQPAQAALDQGVYMRNLDRREVLAAAFTETGLTLGERRRVERARLAADCARSLAPRNPDTFNMRGILARERGEPRLALLEFERAIALDPAFAQARFNRANCLLSLGETKAARLELTELSRLDEGLALAIAEHLRR